MAESTTRVDTKNTTSTTTESEPTPDEFTTKENAVAAVVLLILFGVVSVGFLGYMGLLYWGAIKPLALLPSAVARLPSTVATFLLQSWFAGQASAGAQASGRGASELVFRV